MPSKALLRPVEVLDGARALPGVAETLGAAGSTSGPCWTAATRFTHNHDDCGQVEWANGHGIDVVRGRGSWRARGRVEVTCPTGAPTICKRGRPS